MADKYEHARANARNWYNSIVEMVEALAQADANRDGIAQDSARDAITESVLSVEVRSALVQRPGDREQRRPNIASCSRQAAPPCSSSAP